MITKIKGLLILFCLMSFSMILPAQSMYWGNTTDNPYVSAVGMGTYQLTSGTNITYKISSNLFQRYKSGVLTSNGLDYSFAISIDSFTIFKNSQVTGYCIPSTGRFYAVSSMPNVPPKADQIGVLNSGKLYDNQGNVRFTVDSGLPIIVVAIFLFMVS